MSNVLTRPMLNIGLSSLVTQEELDLWPHLHDIAIPDVDVNDAHLLLVLDAPHVMVPLEIRAGNPGEPYATRRDLFCVLFASKTFLILPDPTVPSDLRPA